MHIIPFSFLIRIKIPILHDTDSTTKIQSNDANIKLSTKMQMMGMFFKHDLTFQKIDSFTILCYPIKNSTRSHP